VSRKYMFVRQDRPRHQVWVTEEAQAAARKSGGRKIRGRYPCPNCGQMFNGRALGKHKAGCHA